jgi:putative ABC transport system substrate-binding protein
MGTPVKEYVALIRAYLHSIRRIAVIGSPGTLSVLEGAGEPQVASYSVKNSYELVNTINRLEAVDAIVLLPDVSLLTAAAMDEAYLISFKRGIPLIGLSGKQVKQGALLALVFDPVNVGRHIGEKASNAISGSDVGKFLPSPPVKFDLFLNMDTARKMEITIPAELVKRARKVYP